MQGSRGFRAVVSAEGLVLLDIRKGVFFRANHVGARIWEKVIEGATVERVIADVATEFGIPPETSAKDVDDFLSSLLEHGFLERRGDPA